MVTDILHDKLDYHDNNFKERLFEENVLNMYL